MLSNRMIVRASLIGALAVGLGALSLLAGSAVVGSVAGSLNATMGGKALEANTTLFSGDRLEVKDGAAVVALGAGSRMVFGRQTEAAFLREAEAVTVTLKAGNVSLYHPTAGGAVRVKIGELTIEPGKGYATEGEVAMLDGAVMVTAKTGMLKVGDGKRAQDVKTGQTIKIAKAANGPQGAGAGGAVAEHTWTLSNGLEVGGIGVGGVSTFEAIHAGNKVSDLCKSLSPTVPSCP